MIRTTKPETLTVDHRGVVGWHWGKLLPVDDDAWSPDFRKLFASVDGDEVEVSWVLADQPKSDGYHLARYRFRLAGTAHWAEGPPLSRVSM
jgi:hypothetical protein